MRITRVRQTTAATQRRVGFGIAPMVMAWAWLAGCTPAKGERLRAPAQRMAKLSAEVPGNRPLAELDLSGDGKLDAADWEPWVQLEKATEAALSAAKIPYGPEHKLYDGAAKDAPGIFSLVGVNRDGFDVSQVPVARLEELLVETRWAAAQARVAAAAGLTLGTQPVGGSLASLLAGYNNQKMTPASLCEALGSLDISPYARAGLAPTAIFDLDSTVWAGNVTDLFLAVLAERTVSKPEANDALKTFLKTVPGLDPAVIDGNSVGANAAILLERSTNREIPKEQRISPKDSFYNIVGLLAGMTPAEADPAVKAAFYEGTKKYPALKTRLFKDEGSCGMADVVRILGERGVKVHVLSATLDILAVEGARMVGLPSTQVMGSILEIKDGKFTGKVAQSTYYTKGAITRQWLPSPPLLAFGDSPSSDFRMLQEATVTSFMINPRDKLQALDDKEAGSRMVALWFVEEPKE